MSEVGAMVCELGVACCTLVQIFSLRASAVHSGGGSSEFNSQMALGIASLLATCAGLVIMLMGTTVALRIMYTVWNTVLHNLDDQAAALKPELNNVVLTR